CVRSVSHPFAASPSQSPKPSSHEGTHFPFWHAGVACTLLHGLPHAPQSLALVLRFVSQPFSALPSQSARPGAHSPPDAVVLPPLVDDALGDTVEVDDKGADDVLALPPAPASASKPPYCGNSHASGTATSARARLRSAQEGWKSSRVTAGEFSRAASSQASA